MFPSAQCLSATTLRGGRLALLTSRLSAPSISRSHRSFCRSSEASSSSQAPSSSQTPQTSQSQLSSFSSSETSSSFSAKSYDAAITYLAKNKEPSPLRDALLRRLDEAARENLPFPVPSDDLKLKPEPPAPHPTSRVDSPPYSLRDDDGFRVPVMLKDENGRGPFARHENVRASVKKLIVTINLMRHMNVEEAILQMKMSPRKSARYVMACLYHAKKEAVLNFNWDARLLGVEKIKIMKGPVQKNPSYRAKGRTNIINTRFSHIEIELKLLDKRESEVMRNMEVVPERKELVMMRLRKEAERIAKLDPKYHYGIFFPKSSYTVSQERRSQRLARSGALLPRPPARVESPSGDIVAPAQGVAKMTH